MKKASLYTLVMIMLLVCCIAAADTYSLDQTVPFGIIEVTEGNTAPLYKKASTKNRIGEVDNGTICQIQATERIGGVTWNKVRYFDQDSEEIVGYITGASISQMTLAGLIGATADSDVAQYLQNFIGLMLIADTDEVVEQRSGSSLAAVEPTPTPAPTPKPLSYILNASSRKFHKPTCNSVKDISEKNRREYTGTRDDLIRMGYSPCKRCNP